jgi:5'-nucleotidase/UDP-sugar diphosphatase
MTSHRTLTAAALAASAALAGVAGAQSIEILHHSDGESQLIDAGGSLSDFGGVARFATRVADLRAAASAAGRDSILLTSGDNFLAGPEFNASLDNGTPYYDAIALDLIGYDAFVIGNHDFDFGPQILANFITSFSATQPPFLSCNLDFSAEAALESLRTAGRIASRTVVTAGGEQIGIVGATTPDLPFISSPGGVTVDPDVAGRIQAEVDALLAEGVTRIIVVSHLQGIGAEIALAGVLTGVDVIIAGGGGELLANPGDLLVPGDTAFDSYPILATDPDGRSIPVVGTAGDYRYIGRLAVTFDAAGEITAIDSTSGPVRVAGGAEPDVVKPEPTIQATVVDPVAAAVAGLASNVIADNQVPLDAIRANIRGRETNYGNLIADSYIWQANQLAEQFNLPTVNVAVTNGGGIRNDSIVPVGDYTELDTFSALPFGNFLAVFADLPAETLLAVLENCVSRVDVPAGFPSGGNGRFGQIAGLMVQWNEDVDPNAGRIRSVRLADGTPVVLDGQVVADPPVINLVTVDFLARGGDEYPLGGLSFTGVGVAYQRALANFIEADAAVGGLGGVITAADYPVGGEGRNVQTGADLDRDDDVDFDDLLILLADFGLCGSFPCPSDLDGDGTVDFDDLLSVLARFGG